MHTKQVVLTLSCIPSFPDLLFLEENTVDMMPTELPGLAAAHLIPLSSCAHTSYSVSWSGTYMAMTSEAPSLPPP